METTVDFPEDGIMVLDKGYVRLDDIMGNDLSVVNAARVSYNKKATEMTEKDEKLIKFLAKNDHTSPFRHATLKFEVYAPLMVARQHWKYVVGADHIMDGWNESSRRYITEEPVFYIPDVWRLAPDNKKQGSGGPVDAVTSQMLTAMLMSNIERSERDYKIAIEDFKIAPEQARLFLPSYGMYVRYIWTTSLQGVLHFLDQRLEHDAQWEIQQYAKAVDFFVEGSFPVSRKWWLSNE